MTEYTDTEMLNWLERMGNGIALIHDDSSAWAVCGTGFQSIRESDTDDLETSFFIESTEFRPTAREAIAYAMSEWNMDGWDEDQ